MKAVQPKEFVVRLADVGTDTYRAHYKKFTDPNAIRLLYKTARHMVLEFIPEEKTRPQIMYWLACKILAQINFDWGTLRKNVDEVNKQLDEGMYTMTERVE